jgi:hypothetical protein
MWAKGASWKRRRNNKPMLGVVSFDVSEAGQELDAEQEGHLEQQKLQ